MSEDFLRMKPHPRVEVLSDKEAIIKKLSAISNELKHMTDNDKKIKILIDLNEFIKINKEIIKKNVQIN